MNLSRVWMVFRKEVRETLRDRRTLIVMLVVPIFLYPVLMVVVQQLLFVGQRSLEQREATVTVRGAPPEALAFLDADSALRTIAVDSLSLAVLDRGGADAVVDFGPAAASAGATQPVRVLYDASRDPSRRAREVAERRLREWGDTLLAARLRAEGLPPTFAAPLEVSDSSVASAERLGGYTLGRMLPAILILMTLLGAFFPAIDLTAGEKERGTLETLLTTPVPGREIVAGKFLTVLAAALTTATLNLVSMLLTFESGLFQMSRATGFEFSVPASSAWIVMLLMVPLAVFFSALFLGMAVRAQSFKEAQNALTPVQFASIIPIYLPMIPGIPLSYAVALVPIGGIAVLFRDLMAGRADPGPAVVAVVAMAVYAALALRFAAHAFGREEVLFGGGSGDREALSLRDRVAAWRTSDLEVPRPTEALAFVAGVGLLYFYLGVRLQIVGLERGLFAAQWLFLALPAVLFAAAGPYRLRSTLALRAPAPRGLLAAALIIAGGMPIGWTIGWLQGKVLEIPEEYLRVMEKLLVADDPGRLAWLLLVVALTPAVCEELVFRGVLLHGLGRHLTMRRAVVGSAVIFGAFHLSFETVIRFLPTAWLGLLMGYVVWQTRSLFTSMLMHFLNNGAAVVLVSRPELQTLLLEPGGAPRWQPVAASILLFAAGMWLLPRRGEPAPSEAAAREIARHVAPRREEGAR